MRAWLRPRILLTTFLFSPLALSDCPELITNGDFESGTTAPWVLFPDSFVSEGIFADPYNPGNEYYRFQYRDYGNVRDVFDAGLTQTVSVTAGATYRLTFWALGDDQYDPYTYDDTSPGWVTLAAGDGYGDYVNYGLDEPFEWVWNLQAGDDYTFEFEATESGPAALTFFFGEEDVDILIDSIFLQEISSPECDASGGAGGTGGGGSGGASTGGASSGGASSGGASTGGASSGGASTGGAGTGGAGTGGAGNTGGIGGQIHNNQLGYVTSAEKVATLVHAATTPQAWQLRNDAGTVVASGSTVVSGTDAPSGDHTHLIDFSAYQTEGLGYRLWVGNAAGPAFRIGGASYADLRRDALRFFYYQRASEAISSTFSEGAEYARAAGHTDPSITCTSPTECTYSLDTRFGWYDAGDYGKYVVNGGISVWTLLYLYERTQHLGADLDALGDDLNNIPESDNGTSDLLDEVKKELVFFLGMQVPSGQALAGMAHHKAHSQTWDGIPVLPSAAGAHFLRPPSTAATLNLAATAAQCARIYEAIDATLAADCLQAAGTAYAAAVANPSRLAPSTDSSGGGSYDDAEVSDEFYWAAAELFITTGESQYLDAVLASPHHNQLPADGAAMSWPTTATLGMISLATVPSGLTAPQRQSVRSALVNRAQDDLAMAGEGYGTSIDGFYWGSNSSVLNASLLHAIAYDLSDDADHRAAALAGLDYVLGRNPLGKSYVTGYGVAPFQNAHHRTWAYGFGYPSWPVPPPGVLAGGPNQNLEGLDPSAIASIGLTGCAPSKCWADYAAGYSLTEVTINWNAPLAWLASWASELQTVADGGGGGTGSGGAGAGGTGSGTGGAASGSGGEDGEGSGGADSGGTGGEDGSDGGSSSDGGSGDCTVGDEGCECYPNDTCNDDLSCNSGTCERGDDGTDGGSDGTEAAGGCSHAPRGPTPEAPLTLLALAGLGWLTRRRVRRGSWA